MLVSLSPTPQVEFGFRDLWHRLQAKGKTVLFLFFYGLLTSQKGCLGKDNRFAIVVCFSHDFRFCKWKKLSLKAALSRYLRGTSVWWKCSKMNGNERKVTRKVFLKELFQCTEFSSYLLQLRICGGMEEDWTWKNSCYRSCAHGQGLLCLQLRADEAYGSIQWKMASFMC